MQVIWYRRDLRCHDHPALAAARAEGDVAALFVLDPALLAAAGAHRPARLAASLRALDAAWGRRLLIAAGDPREVVPRLAGALGAHAVHVSAETTPAGRARDAAVAAALAARGVAWRPAGTPYAIGPGSVLTGAGTPYRVFTPFSRAWRARAVPGPAASGTGPGPGPGDLPGDPALAEGAALVDRLARLDVAAAIVEGAGEDAALARWARFVERALPGHAAARELPAVDGTSGLSAALKYGEVHPRTLIAGLRDAAAAEIAGPEDVERFETELIWREFAADVLWHRPDARRAPLDGRAAAVRLDDPADRAGDLAAWRAGRTGYPLVDAGQRQLLATGWMHNRVRMVVAAFLVKDLHLPWQVGAAHFLHLLVDGDVASNSFNWQWAAGTGADAAPYHRVFNPVTQAERFDPDGDYVRRWVPELAHLPGRAALTPWERPDGHDHGYPHRIVDHAVERVEALARWQQAGR